MAASTSGAIKAYLETNTTWKPEVGVPVFRDRVRPDQPLPYITVSEARSVVPGKRGDNGANSTASELVDVDLWQEWVDEDSGKVSEIPDLANAIARALRGCRLTAAPQTVYGVKVNGRVRITDDDHNYVHDNITLSVERLM